MVRHSVNRDAKEFGDLGAITGLQEVAARKQAGDVGIEARTHSIALAGNAVGAGAGTTDVSRHQGHVNNGLGGAGGFMALVDAHSPPKAHRFAVMNRFREAIDLPDGQTGLCGHLVGSERTDKLSEFSETGSAPRDKSAIDPAVLDEEIGHTIEQREVGLGAQRQMLGGSHGGFGAARVHDYDPWLILVSQDALPHNRVSDAGIGADKNQHISQFEICVRKWRGVEPEALFIRDVCCGHALACVGVAVDGANPEFPKRA